VGNFKGYIPHNFIQDPFIDNIISQIETFTTLLEIAGYVEFQFYESMYYQPLPLYIYKENNCDNVAHLEHQLSDRLISLKLKDDLFANSHLLSLLGSNLSPVDNLKRNLSNIIKYFNLLEDNAMSNNLNKFNLSLRWYLSGIVAQNRTVALIHFCILIESILGSNRADANKGIEIPERAALFVGQNFEDRKSIIEALSKVLNKRNKIIHNGDIFRGRQDIKYYLDAIFYSRKILQKGFEIIMKM